VCSINDGDLLPRIWDTQSGELLHQLGGDQDPKVAQYTGAFEFSPIEHELATAHVDGRIRIWNTRSGELLDEIRGHNRGCVGVAYSDDGDWIVSASSDGTVKLWNLRGGLETVVSAPSGWGTGIAFSPRGDEFAAGGNYVERTEWPRLQKIATENAMEDRARGRWVHYTPDGQLFSARAKADADLVAESVWVYWKNGKVELNTAGSTVRSVAIAPDASQILTAAHGAVTMWNRSSGAMTWQIEQTGMSSAFHPQGTMVAVGGDGYCKVYDALNGNELAEMKGRPGGFGCVRFSPDEKALAGGAWDGTIQIWEAASGERVCDIVGHSDYVNSLAFSPDGKRLASGDSGGVVRLWNTKTGELLGEFRGSLSITGNPGQGLAFSPDGLALVSATSDGRIKIWRAASLQEVSETLPSN